MTTLTLKGGADCLDRTNFVQDILSRLALESFFRNTQADWGYSEANLWSAHRTLFAEVSPSPVLPAARLTLRTSLPRTATLSAGSMRAQERSTRV